MTADELQNIVRVMANNLWVRYWFDWRILSDREKSTMVVSALDIDGRNRPVYCELPELEERGFTKVLVGRGGIYYAVYRTDEHGQPWRYRIRL